MSPAKRKPLPPRRVFLASEASQARTARDERETIAQMAEQWAVDAREKGRNNAPHPNAWALVESWLNSFAGAVRVRSFIKPPTHHHQEKRRR